MIGKEKKSFNVISDPLVSVCIVTYNHEGYIGECLDSILNQKTNFKFNIILGEDCSTDSTRDICIKYAEDHPDKIKLYLRKREDVIYINGKATGRYNFIESLKSCKGKYIALCEGDDYWTDPYKLQKQVDFLEKNNSYSSCFHDVLVSGEINNKKIDRGKIFNKNDLNSVNIVDFLLSKYTLFHTSSFLFRSKFLEFPSWFEEISCGDLPLFLIVISKGKSKRIKGVMGVYRKHKLGITNSTLNTKSLMIESRVKMLEYFDEYLEYKYSKYISLTKEAYQNNKPVKSILSRKSIIRKLKVFVCQLKTKY